MQSPSSSAPQSETEINPSAPSGKLGPIPTDVFHVQGLSISQNAIYLTSVDKNTAAAYLWKLNGKADKLIKYKRISENLMYHPSGLQTADGKIYVAIAVYTEKSNSKVLILDETTMKPIKKFFVPDHIGLVAADGSGRIFGANWNARKFYIWDENGKLLETRENPTGRGYQDCKVRRPHLICSGNGRIDFIDMDKWTLSKTLIIGEAPAGNNLTREGMDSTGGNLYFLPDDGKDTFIYTVPVKQ